MLPRSPSVLATGAGLLALLVANAARAESVRLLRVAIDAQAVVVRQDDESMRLVRVGDRVGDSAWTLSRVAAGRALFAFGDAQIAGALIVELRAGDSLDLARTPASVQSTAHPGIVATHVVPTGTRGTREP